MKRAKRLGLSLALLATPVCAVSTASAADLAVVPTVETGWDFHGAADFGYRAAIERPPLAAGKCVVFNGTPPGFACPSRDTRAGFEKFGEMGSGPVLDYLHLYAGTKDGLYYSNLWASDVGYNNQSYLLEVAQAGFQYFTVAYDQSPYLFSTSALSIWGGTPNALVTPFVFAQNPASTFAAQQQINNQILNGANVISLGTRRDTASVAYRATPTPEWDIQADYSNQRRTGTLPQSAIIQSAFGSPSMQLPRPVDDRTQEANVSAEYAGYTFWGSKFNVKSAWMGSVYQNDYAFFTFQNPFTGGTPNATFPAFGMMSLPPDNTAQSFTTTAGVDLPFQTRYMGTIQYEIMRQDEAFTPQTVNQFITPAQLATIPLPATSLNGQVNTLLVNNVLTTKITSDLKSTFKFRYYDLDNQTPTLTFPGYVVGDVQVKTGPPDLPRRNLVISYTKENASEDLNWHPERWLNLGVTGGFERWDRDRMDANVTTEWFGRAYADLRGYDAMSWATLHASYQFSERRYDSYDYLDYVARVAYASATESVNSSLMRMFDMANRDRAQGKLQLDLEVPGNLTVSPNGGFKLDSYNLDPVIGTYGVQSDHSWFLGADLAWQPERWLTVLGSYMHEQHDEQLQGASASMLTGTGVNTVSSVWNTGIQDSVNTYMVAVNIQVIPNALDFKASYTIVHDVESWNTVVVTGNPTIAPFPNVTNDFQRFDAMAKYRFDPDLVRRMGWNGDVIAKLRYTWERNAVNNWQDVNVPDMWFIDNSANRQLSMAATNPNYTAQVLVASLGLKW